MNVIALDNKVLVRYLKRDDAEQAEAARALLESLTIGRPGFVCREVTVELVWVLERSYSCSRDRIAAALEQLVTTESLVVEAAANVVHAASRYRSGVVGFSDLMILATAERSEAYPLYTFEQKAARLEGVDLLQAGEKQNN